MENKKEIMEEIVRGFGLVGTIDILENVIGLDENQKETIINSLVNILSDDQLDEIYGELESCR